MPPPSPLPAYVYKILPEAPPEPLPDTLPLSPLDAKDGFIHFSTAEQTPATAGRFYSHTGTLWLLKIPLDRIGHNVKWDETTSGCFAHLYDAGLGKKEVLEMKRFEKQQNGGSWKQVLGKEKWLA